MTTMFLAEVYPTAQVVLAITVPITIGWVATTLLKLL